MSSAVNLRIDPRTGVSNWVGPITEGNGDAEFDVAEFPELPGVYGVILTQRPHPTDIEVYLTSDPSNPLTRVRKVTEPASDEFWSDSDQRNPRGYIIVNSSLAGQNLTIVYKAGGYLAHKRVLETVIPEGPPGPAGGVDSVFGRSGNVTAQSGDYNLDQISDGITNKAFTATEKTKLAGMGSGANVSSVFSRTGDVTAQAGDYSAFYQPLITSGTAQATTSGTSKDFTGIPSTAKRITIMLDGVSLTGNDFLMIQIGDSGGIETSGYVGTAGRGTSQTALANGFYIDNGANGPNTVNGSMVLTLLDASTNTWSCMAVFGLGTNTFLSSVGGTKSLSATLDRVRLTSQGGSDTFDAGKVNILYE